MYRTSGTLRVEELRKEKEKKKEESDRAQEIKEKEKLKKASDKEKRKKGDFRIVNLFDKRGAFFSTQTKEGTILLDIHGNRYMLDKVPPDPHTGFRITGGRDMMMAVMTPVGKEKMRERLKAAGKI